MIVLCRRANKGHYLVISYFKESSVIILISSWRSSRQNRNIVGKYPFLPSATVIAER